jgi:hypothetical protein
MVASESLDSLRLRRIELEQHGTAWPEDMPRLEQRPPDQVQTVRSAVERLSRLV